ncbi:MAG: dNK protein [Anaerolineales bacterium]|jgi:deoxyguanosine kinase|nr:dNK protein [Anaerolineales bacterium]
MYIAIEGVIGVGKTSLARLLQPAFGAQVLLEVFEENPFLSDFYSDRARYAFQTQMFFLLSRYHQQRVVPVLLERGPLIADYTFAKDALFARINLRGDELTLYHRLHDALAEKMPRPDLLVYLRAPTDVLMQRIAQRGRSYERQMERAYIDELNRAYDEFFAGHRPSPVLTIEAEGLDFVANPEDLRAVTDRIQSALGLGAYQTPLMLRDG